MKINYKSRIACKTIKPKYIGVESDDILEHLNYWQYPYNLKDWEGFFGQWRIKYKYAK